MLAIYKPRKELILSFLLFVIFEYYFTLAAYLYFSDHYQGECADLWRCYIKTFDWTFKENGAVGSFLKDPSTIKELNL